MAQSDMDVDSGEKDAPADMSGAQTLVVASKAVKNENADEDADNNEEENVSKEQQVDALAASLEAIEEALRASVESCKATYVTAIGSLLSTACTRYNELIESIPEDEQEHVHLDPELLCTVSILKRTLRVFHGTEKELVRVCATSDEDSSKIQITSFEEAKKSIEGVNNIPAFIKDAMKI